MNLLTLPTGHPRRGEPSTTGRVAGSSWAKRASISGASACPSTSAIWLERSRMWPSCCIGCWLTARPLWPAEQREPERRREPCRINRRQQGSGGLDTSPVRRSRRRDDGSGQAANAGAAVRRLRVLRLVDQSSSDPIRQRPTRRLRTEARPRRQDHVHEGLTPQGPLQKPAFLTSWGASGSLNGQNLFCENE